MFSRDFAEIESRWRNRWAIEQPYRAVRHSDRPKCYILDFFPYPSGSGLSVGHAKNYVPSCVSARYHRMRGFDVLHPMGWDAFGLPAENYAVVHGVHPRDTLRACSDRYRRQLQLLECSYDWSREIDSSDPEFYQFTQSFFLLLFERDLAYQAPGEQWWCPSCRTILANEQVQDGACWRCSSRVETKTLVQWYFRITRYADRLLNDLERLDWPEHVKAMQQNWIGRSEPDASDPNGSYRLRDWLISRQRYWGAPIPIIHCPNCGPVAVPRTDLPVRLPEIDDYAPADDGRSPLARVENWVRTRCPKCGGPGRRETDTMDGFACSSWYFLRFTSPHSASVPFDPQAVVDWMPVDIYVGGAEHAVMHLLYARFWTKVLFDAGLIPFDEPFTALRTQGTLRSAVDGKRMAKSRPEGVVTPDEVIERHGTDAMRAHVCFLGPFDADVVWNEDGIRGISRFLDRYWDLSNSVFAVEPTPQSAEPSPEERRVQGATQALIRRVTDDLDGFRFNTAIAKLMEHLNLLTAAEPSALSPAAWRRAIEVFTLLLAPFCPFVAEEVWRSVLGHAESVHRGPWPVAEASLRSCEERTIVVQVDGRVRARMSVSAQLTDSELRELATRQPEVRERLVSREITNVIVVGGRLVNVVTRALSPLPRP